MWALFFGQMGFWLKGGREMRIDSDKKRTFAGNFLKSQEEEGTILR